MVFTGVLSLTANLQEYSMSRITVNALDATVRSLEARIIELEVRLAKYEATGTQRIVQKAEPIVTTFTDRLGRIWEKTRVGKFATMREITA